MCNCNKGKSGPGAKTIQQYALVLPNGTKQVYETEAAARKANAQIGNKGLVRKVR